MSKVTTFLFCLFTFSVNAQHTIGLINYQVPNTDGYVLFAPLSSDTTYLIDKCGEKIHQWLSSYRPGNSVYLLNDGSLLRTGCVGSTIFTSGGNGGIIEKYDWNGALTWSYLVADSMQCQHHDIMSLPNGNILVIVWDRRTNTDAIANGKNPATTNAYLWSEKIIELQPVGMNSANIVWEWRLWDHLVQEFDQSKLNYDTVSQHPELININYFTGSPINQDWIHLNAIDYNAQLDQIVVSSHNLNEIWIIDHSTTTAEAATHAGGNSGKGGDILYRWGNSQAYNRGVAADKKIFGQHHATWIPQGYPNAGKILVFNNGLNRPAGAYSSVEIIETPIDSNNQYPIGVSSAFLPVNPFWIYTAPTPTDFYGQNISGAYPMQNGSFIITNGPKGIFFEIDSTQQTVWKYISPVNNSGTLSQGSIPANNNVFRCVFYPSSYTAFAGQSLVPQGEIELNAISPSICDSLLSEIKENHLNSEWIIYPNPFRDELNLESLSQKEGREIKVIDVYGREITLEPVLTTNHKLQTSNWPAGIYFVSISNYCLKVIKL